MAPLVRDATVPFLSGPKLPKLWPYENFVVWWFGEDWIFLSFCGPTRVRVRGLQHLKPEVLNHRDQVHGSTRPLMCWNAAKIRAPISRTEQLGAFSLSHSPAVPCIIGSPVQSDYAPCTEGVNCGARLLAGPKRTQRRSAVQVGRLRFGEGGSLWFVRVGTLPHGASSHGAETCEVFVWGTGWKPRALAAGFSERLVFTL
jgi:hypothetical protein